MLLYVVRESATECLQTTVQSADWILSNPVSPVCKNNALLSVIRDRIFLTNKLVSMKSQYRIMKQKCVNISRSKLFVT